MGETEKNTNKLLTFLCDVVRGAAIGVAFIIPGFSGGTVAAILGIYEKLVGASSDLFKHFGKSFLTLLPIALGMLLGIAALILPIQWGLAHYPIPTTTLFVGLAFGGLPSVLEKMKGGEKKAGHIAALLLPLVFAAALSFLPHAEETDLFSLDVWGYLLLVLIGIVGSCALVVPGISGSMLLLIFGYYNPIVRLVTDSLLKGVQVGTCILVLACLCVGIVIGFFAISHLMKFLLSRFPKGTYFAIFGFILGSVPAVYASVIRETGKILFENPWYWVVAVVLFLVGCAVSFALYYFSKRKKPA